MLAAVGTASKNAKMRRSCYSKLWLVTPDLYQYNALRLSYENASIFAAFASVAFVPGSPYTELYCRTLV